MLSMSDLGRGAGGRLMQLSAEQTLVVDEGHDENGTIVLVHGATVPHWECGRLALHLRSAGLRVVRFDLFGQGLSDRPKVAYGFDVFFGQALEVLGSLADLPLRPRPPQYPPTGATARRIEMHCAMVGAAPLRYLAISSELFPETSEYPGSERIAILDDRPDPTPDSPRQPFRLVVRAGREVDFWDGE